MVRVRLAPEKFAQEELLLEGELFHYLVRVHRLRANDQFEAITGSGGWGQAEITRMNEHQIVARWIKKGERAPAGPEISLFQGLPKGKKFDLIVEKATELGVGKIVPVLAARSVPERDSFAAPHQRWCRIAESAALQSRRATVPDVTLPVPFDQACQLAAQTEQNLFVWEQARERSLKQLLEAVPVPQNVAVWIGPEGGWSPAESAAAVAAGACLVGLGENILRTETAGFVMLSILGFCWGGLAAQPDQGST